MQTASPLRLLVAAATPAGADRLAHDAMRAGFEVVGRAACRNLVHALTDLAPDGVLMQIDTVDDALLDDLSAWVGSAPCALAVFAERSDPVHTQRAVTIGVHAWVVGEGATHRLAAVMQVAHARWLRECAWRAQLDDARRELDERKWIERAKSVLMSARDIDEGEAYRMLRSAAMRRQTRMGQVSRSVIDASNWAEAVNRAGQLRMLSQRLVRLAAQRLIKVGVRRALELQEASLQRARDNVARLEQLVPGALRQPALEQTRLAWQALEHALESRLSADAVTRADACAETLLQAAERLTHALEFASGRRALHVVNLSGRQRMLAQRVAKEAMLAAVTGGLAKPEPLSAALREFEAALAVLQTAPLSSTEIHHDLQCARDEWGRLLRSGRADDDATALADCAAASDVLVQIFDRLTEQYQTSLEALVG